MRLRPGVDVCLLGDGGAAPRRHGHATHSRVSGAGGGTLEGLVQALHEGKAQHGRNPIPVARL